MLFCFFVFVFVPVVDCRVLPSVLLLLVGLVVSLGLAVPPAVSDASSTLIIGFAWGGPRFLQLSFLSSGSWHLFGSGSWIFSFRLLHHPPPSPTVRSCWCCPPYPVYSGATLSKWAAQAGSGVWGSDLRDWSRQEARGVTLVAVDPLRLASSLSSWCDFARLETS